MLFRVLGPVELDGDSTAVPSARLRKLAALLLVHAGEVVSVDRIADVLWGAEQPMHAAGAVQTLVSRLRAAVRRATDQQVVSVETRAPGYLLRLPRDMLDATIFADQVAAGRAALPSDPARTAELLDAALRLWRGQPYAEFADEDFAAAEVTRLRELRRAALQDRCAADLELGDYGQAAGMLETLIAEDPLAERPHELLMHALHGAGRSADALRHYREYRLRIADELGLDPSERLQDLESVILSQARVPAAGNLPGQLGGLIGRQDELALATQRLAGARVLTLTGAAGVGKTRLALAVAQQVRPDYPDGVWLCDLSQLGTGSRVDDLVATTLGVPQRPGGGLRPAITGFLHTKSLLLVLDNCEHVIDAACLLADTIARQCPDVRLLATSTQRLGVNAERGLLVPPLRLPEPAEAADVRRARDVPAIALFAERAAEVAPGFLLAPHLAEVADICARLDGIALAIELAATRTAAMTPAEIRDRLDDRLSFLRSSRRIAAERQRTLLSLLDWSYNLLSEDERVVFRRLSVFAGAFTMNAAEHVCARDDVAGPTVTVALLELVDKSLVTRGTVGNAETRYRLLETVRQYGRRLLDDSGEAEQVRGAHAAYCAGTLAGCSKGLRGAGEEAAVSAIGRDLDEVRWAYDWAIDHEPAIAVDICANLAWYAEFRMTREVFGWAGQALRRADAEPALATRAGFAAVAAFAASGAAQRGDRPLAVRLAERAVATGDERARAHALAVLVDVAVYEGRLDDADRDALAAAELARAGGHDFEAAWALVGGALARCYRGDTAGALELAEQGQVRAEKAANPSMRAWIQYVFGEALLDSQPEQASAALRASIALARQVDNRLLLGVATVSAASLLARDAASEFAFGQFAEALRLWRELGNRTHQWTTIRNLIVLLVRVDATEQAAVLYGAVTTSSTAAPAYGTDAERLAAAAATVSDRMGRQAFADAVARGRIMDDDEAFGYASEVAAVSSR